MTTYDAITNDEVNPGSPGTTALFTKLRDNPIAIAEGAAGAPVIAGLSCNFLATADASNDATIDFTAFDATTYDAYLFVLSNVIPATDAATLELRTSTNGGSTYDSGGSNYAWGYASLRMDGSSGFATPSNAGSSSIRLTGGIGSDANEDGASLLLTVFGPHLARRTRFSWQGTYQSNDAVQNGTYINGGGFRQSAADVDAVRFLFSSGNIESGTITMYGLRNA